jgi:hypothetical protein
MNKVQIYGERCSGTNYLQELITNNFDVKITWEYGWKHFFGFRDLTNSDDVLFIGIIRSLDDWVNSLYREKYHLPPELTENEHSFLTYEFYSIYENNNEIMDDRNIETLERYKNIFELRHVKNKYLIETMPKLVKNYILITYEELCDNFYETMNNIKNKGLLIKNDIEFPLNISYYKQDKNSIYVKKENSISSEYINKKANMEYEIKLFPKKYRNVSLKQVYKPNFNLILNVLIQNIRRRNKKHKIDIVFN